MAYGQNHASVLSAYANLLCLINQATELQLLKEQAAMYSLNLCSY